MRKYCKAYFLKDLRGFSGWTEKYQENEGALPADTICYLWDDFIVVKSPVQDQGIIFDEVTPEWQSFCTTTLNFTIPEDRHTVYAKNVEPEKMAL